MSPSSATLTRPALSPTAPSVHDERPNRPRVWLVGRVGSPAEPTDLPAVRDTTMRTWRPGADGIYHSADGWHHTSWYELRSRCDLVEVA
jgi:hypothetical protein